jgi:maleylacetoacetate isomerase
VTPTLYTYARSSASWRVRIALAWKAIAPQTVPVDLLHDGGEQHLASYRALNPQGLVPVLIIDGAAIAQSVAICEYLEERFPQPPLLPSGHLERAQVRSLVQAIACDIHPLNNLRVLQYLKRSLGHSQQEIDAWYRHWIGIGFAAIEAELTRCDSWSRCLGNAVSLADVFLVPQVFNARRLGVDLTVYPRIVGIDAALSALPAFAETAPSKQPDFA